MKNWIDALIGELVPRYTPPHVRGAHDYTHCERLVKWGEQIQGIMGLDHKLNFDTNEYEVACWLHNLDRASDCVDLERELRCILEASPFDLGARARIIDTVLRHSKKDDEPGDCDLLQAVRIADKVDRWSASGVIGAGQSAAALPPYNSEHPFGYGSTEEEHVDRADIYRLFFRPIEWYAMLPSDEARALIPERSFRYMIETVRLLAEEASWVTGKANKVEGDLRKALGKYYQKLS